MYLSSWKLKEQSCYFLLCRTLVRVVGCLKDTIFLVASVSRRCRTTVPTINPSRRQCSRTLPVFYKLFNQFNFSVKWIWIHHILEELVVDNRVTRHVKTTQTIQDLNEWRKLCLLLSFSLSVSISWKSVILHISFSLFSQYWAWIITTMYLISCVVLQLCHY